VAETIDRALMVAAPHVDLPLSEHDLASLEKLAILLPGLN
jgi:hypothetical protein